MEDQSRLRLFLTSPQQADSQGRSPQQQQLAAAAAAAARAVPVWRPELQFLLEAAQSCERQLSTLPPQSEAASSAAIAAAAAAAAAGATDDGVADAAAAAAAATLPSLREPSMRSYLESCVALLSTDAAAPQRQQAETALLTMGGAPGYLMLLLQSYLQAAAAATAHAAVHAAGAAAAADPLLHTAESLRKPGVDPEEQAFVALLLLKGAFQARRQAATAAATSYIEVETRSVMSSIVSLVLHVRPPRLPKTFSTLCALLRRLARSAAAAAATPAAAPAAAAAAQQLLNSQALQAAAAKFACCLDERGDPCICVAAAEPLAQETALRAAAAAEGALVPFLLRGLMARLLAAAAANAAAEATLYGHLLNSELVTLRIGGGRAFGQICAALLPLLQQPAAAAAASLQQALQTLVVLKQQQQQQQDGQLRQQVKEALDSWISLAKLGTHVCSALLLVAARASPGVPGSGDTTALLQLQQLLLLLLRVLHEQQQLQQQQQQQQQHQDSSYIVEEPAWPFVLKLSKVLFKELSFVNVLLLLLLRLQCLGASSSNADTGLLLLPLPLQLIAAPVGGCLELLQDDHSGTSSAAAAAAAAGVRAAAAEELRAFFASVGGFQGLVKRLGPPLHRAEDGEANEFFCRPEVMYGSLGSAYDDEAPPARAAAVSLLRCGFQSGLLGWSCLTELCSTADAALQQQAEAEALGSPDAILEKSLSAMRALDGILSLLKLALQAALQSPLFDQDLQRQQQQQRVAVLLLGAEAPAALGSAAAEQQQQLLQQQFGCLCRSFQVFLSQGPFAAAAVAAAANEQAAAGSLLAVVAARCCALLKLLLQLHPKVALPEIRGALAFLFDELLLPQPLIKILIDNLHRLQQREQHRLQQLTQEQQVLLQQQQEQIRAFVQTGLTSPILSAVTKCLHVGALSLAKALIKSYVEKQEASREQQHQHQQVQQQQLPGLPFRELQRPLLLLLAQSSSSAWTSRLLKLLLLLQCESRDEQQQQPLTDDFFDLSALPNYADSGFLVKALTGSSSSSSGGGVDANKPSEVYQQLLRQYGAYANNEGTQQQLLLYFHGALLLGRPEVPVHLKSQEALGSTLPGGLLKAAMQTAGWALALGAEINPQAEQQTGAVQRAALRLLVGIFRAVNLQAQGNKEMGLVLQFMPALADVQLPVLLPQQPLLLLTLLEAAAICLEACVSPAASAQVQRMTAPILPLFNISVEGKLLQCREHPAVVRQQVRACSMLLLLLLLLQRGDWPVLPELLQQAVAAAAKAPDARLSSELEEGLVASLPVLCCWGLRYPRNFFAAAAAAAARQGASYEALGPFAHAPEALRLNELLLRFATLLCTAKKAAYLPLVGLAFAALSVGIVSRCLALAPSLTNPEPSSSSSNPALLAELAPLHLERCMATLRASHQLIAAAAAASGSNSSSSSMGLDANAVEVVFKGGPCSLMSPHLARQILSLSGEAAAGAAAAAAALQQLECSSAPYRRSTAMLHLCLSGAPLRAHFDVAVAITGKKAAANAAVRIEAEARAATAAAAAAAVSVPLLPWRFDGNGPSRRTVVSLCDEARSCSRRWAFARPFFDAAAAAGFLRGPDRVLCLLLAPAAASAEISSSGDAAQCRQLGASVTGLEIEWKVFVGAVDRQHAV
ncbi:hypothetical protein Esti_005194 [Eimeria stiedai]